MITTRHGTRRPASLPAVLRALACLPLLAFALGCGESNDDKRNGPARTATATAAVDDGAIAKRAVLRITDFPSGWSAEPNVQSLDSGCEQIEAVKNLTSARESSPRFNRGPGTLVQNVIYVFADETTAKKAFTMVTGEDTLSCYADAVTGAFGSQQGVEVGGTDTAALDIAPIGDEHEATRVTLPVTVEEVEADVTIDLVFARAGRGLSLSLFLDVPTAFDANLRDDLTAAPVQRL